MESPPGSRPTKTLAKSTIRVAAPGPSNCPQDEEGDCQQRELVDAWSVCCATTHDGHIQIPDRGDRGDDQNQGHGNLNSRNTQNVMQRIQMAVVLLGIAFDLLFDDVVAAQVVAHD